MLKIKYTKSILLQEYIQFIIQNQKVPLEQLSKQALN